MPTTTQRDKIVDCPACDDGCVHCDDKGEMTAHERRSVVKILQGAGRGRIPDQPHEWNTPSQTQMP